MDHHINEFKSGFIIICCVLNSIVGGQVPVPALIFNDLRIITLFQVKRGHVALINIDGLWPRETVSVF